MNQKRIPFFTKELKISTLLFKQKKLNYTTSSAFLLGWFLLFSCFSLNTLDAQASGVETAATKLTNDSYLANGIWGLSVVDAGTGEEIYGYNSNKSLKPASSLKSVTTATALSILGPDFKFETLLEYDGFIDEDGTLQGNLYIKGGGDPTLGFERFKAVASYKEILKIWAEAVKKLGIKKINGCILGDDTVYETAMVPNKWMWEDIGNYFGAGASGLNLHENKYSIQFSSGKKKGDPTNIIGVYPPQKGINFINEVRSGEVGSGDEAVIYAAPYTDNVYARGSVPPGHPEFTVKGSIPNPPLFAAQSLENMLEENGVDCAQSAANMRDVMSDVDTNQERKVIHTHQSPKLMDIVYWANQKSINLYCESMLKMMGKQRFGRGNTVYGLKALQEHWRLKGVNLHGSFLYDGSGLSPENAITPKHMAQILATIEEEPWFDEYTTSLRYKLGTYLMAKSGYINRVRAYAGFVKTKKGKLVSFSIMANNYTCSNSAMRKKLNVVMEQIKNL